MPAMTAYPPGTPCWVDLSTSDPAASAAFYTGLFGWTALAAPPGGDAAYTFFAPAGTPSEVVNTLSKASDEVLRIDAVRQRLQAAGVKPLFAPGAEVGNVSRDKISQGAKVIAHAGITPH